MNTFRKFLSLAIIVAICHGVSAKENITSGAHAKTTHRASATGCAVDQGSAYMSINNVRARIMDEGDMWWDPGTGLPRYYVPAAGPACSEFAGALWVGGVDAGGQLKVAAMTYRQNGEDFWTGPINTANFSITPAECLQWDKLFYVTRQEVENWVAESPNYGTPPSDIANWPGNSPYPGDGMLAPYVDVNGDGVYDPGPGIGDYPAYSLSGSTTSCSNDQIFGDATLWWVINDIGNNHTESGGVPIGLEVREQCFAFQTNDAINNMTFLNYQIINQSTYQVNNCYFGAWNDPDLGDGGDDYVGCDVGRSMGYDYNGEPYDPDGSGQFLGEVGYHDDPPAIGSVFFQGPEADPGDNHCYIRNVKGVNVIGMAKFVYYNNDFTVQGNPTKASDYYNYLRGLWQDGTSMTYGGNGYQSSTTPTSYMFDWTPKNYCNGPNNGNTDPTGCGTNGVVQTTEWDEVAANDPFGDRRFMQSAGPFTLKAGAVNYVTVGIVWDQPPPNEGNIAPICLIQQDADLAQALFNNCFQVLTGPDAPDLSIQELNKELVITLSNSPTSNNYNESYDQVSPTIIGYSDNTYKFQGYLIYQLLDSSVSVTQLNDPTQARLIGPDKGECDINNGVGNIVNWITDPTTGLPTPTLEVACQGNGISHSFDVKTDQFQEDEITTLVNDRPYYFMAVAFAYNNYLTYSPFTTAGQLGQKTPYLQGAHNVKVYTAFPHIPAAQNYGTIQNSSYGEGPAITRIEGHGNGTNVLQMDPNSESYILQHDTMANPAYLPGCGPINIKVVDPLSVIPGNFILTIHPDSGRKTIDSMAWWELDDLTRGWIFYSDVPIGTPNEQILPQYGISISINQIPYPSGSYDGVIDSSCAMTFADNTKQWLTFLSTAQPGLTQTYWIRSGNFIDKYCADNNAFNSYIEDILSGTTCPTQVQGPDVGGLALAYFSDSHEYYNQIVGGTWSPYTLCAVSDPGLYCDYGPGFDESTSSIVNVMDSIANIASVDLVITSDKSKWTRCVVFEEEDQSQLSEGNVSKLNLRASESVDMNGNFATPGSGYSSDPNAANYISERSMGWFPGYAINIETGERLNMAYGEDSWLASHNGRTMQWDPDSVLSVQDNSASTGASQLFGISSVMGGKKYIYIFGHNNNQTNAKYNIPFYDKDSTLYNILTTINPASIARKNVFGDVMWCGIPLLKQGHPLLECDVTIKLRVSKPYDTNYGSTTVNSLIKGSTWSNSANPHVGNYPKYSFSLNSLAAVTGSDSVAKSALSLINIVPNPYYAYSDYETSRLDNRVRITNLPPVCTISIFTLSGTLINVINKNDPNTYIDWTLLNQFNVPIASGIYIIHVAVPNVGETTLKWFGVMRPTDLNSY